MAHCYWLLSCTIDILCSALLCLLTHSLTYWPMLLFSIVLWQLWLWHVQIWVPQTTASTTSLCWSAEKSVCGQSLPMMTVLCRGSGQRTFYQLPYLELFANIVIVCRFCYASNVVGSCFLPIFCLPCHGSRGVCLPWLSYPLINRKHLWHQPPKCHHSCCHAELRKSDLEVTARHLSWASCLHLSTIHQQQYSWHQQLPASHCGWRWQNSSLV